jgi:hypothetical protein
MFSSTKALDTRITLHDTQEEKLLINMILGEGKKLNDAKVEVLRQI